MNKLSFSIQLLFFSTFVELDHSFTSIWYCNNRGDTMESYKRLNLMFDEMIDDMKYIKIATFTRKFKKPQ